jgi:hypothetical protein
VPSGLQGFFFAAKPMKNKGKMGNVTSLLYALFLLVTDPLRPKEQRGIDPYDPPTNGKEIRPSRGR